MHSVKRYLWWVPLIIAGVYIVVYVYRTPCKTPITYRIGTFDTEFGISEAEFLSKIDEASKAWEEVVDKDLFAYDPQATFSINLIFDERQAITFKNQTLQSHIEETKDSASAVRAEYEALEERQRTETAQYEAALDIFEREQQAYNQKVSYWNGRGGAPKGEFEKLNKESAALSAKSASLEKQRLILNNRASEINSLINKYNSLIDVANQKIRTINQTAGKEFSEGEYVVDKEGERINIYEFTSETELVRLLAHELGHAVGLEHNPNPSSIMYYLNESKNRVPTAEDRASLKEICRVK